MAEYFSNQIFTTEDGAVTLLSGQYGVSYHSLHGALQETNKVFIEMGLQYKISQGFDKLKIFEMGFGTGLNALCTYDTAIKTKTNIEYTTIEAYPISLQEIDQLNYVEILGEEYQEAFLKMHSSLASEVLDLSNFRFIKYLQDIFNWEPTSKFDIIYYDAFSPTTQPDLWEEPIMRKMFDMLEPDGILCTYCAKGSFKRVLKAVGFEIESMPGPGRKREITRAKKP
jgi:tRNA U34 5-methylaminomethyl-2-thiouridine-forming methyltransferase MnmC